MTPTRRTSWRLIQLFTLVALTPAIAAATDPPSVASILAAHIEASGGARAIAAVDTLVLEGAAHAGPMELQVVETRQRPNKLRLEFRTEDGVIVQATDGDDAWWYDPIMGSGEVVAMPDAYGRGFSRNASLADWFLTADAAGVEVRYLETVVEGERELHRLEISYASGDRQERFYDASSGLYVRKVSPGPQGEMTADMSDFRDVGGGVLYPFRIEMSLGQRYVYTSGRTNVPIDGSLFTRPTEPPS